MVGRSDSVLVYGVSKRETVVTSNRLTVHSPALQEARPTAAVP